MNPRQMALQMALEKVAQSGGTPQATSMGQPAQVAQPAQTTPQEQQPQQQDVASMLGEINDIAKSGNLDQQTTGKVLQAVQQLAEVFRQVMAKGQDPNQVIGQQVQQLYQFVKQQTAGAGGPVQGSEANLAGAMA